MFLLLQGSGKKKKRWRKEEWRRERKIKGRDANQRKEIWQEKVKNNTRPYMRAGSDSPLLGLGPRRFPSCLSPLFQSESKCEAFHMEISFIHTQVLVHLHVNKTNFHMKGFSLGLALEKRRKATQKSLIQ